MLCSDEKVKKNKNARPPKKRNGIIVCTKYYVLEKREREGEEEHPHKDARRYCSYIESSSLLTEGKIEGKDSGRLRQSPL